MSNTKKLNDESDVVYNPESKAKIICIKEHTVTFPDAENKKIAHTYKVGDVHERRDVFLKPRFWELEN